MEGILDQLAAYPDLPPDQREAVRAYVQEHPEHAQALAEARLFASWMGAGRSADGLPLIPGEIADYVVAQHFGAQPLPPGGVARAARVEAALQEHPDLERKAREMRQHLSFIVSESEDAVEQFERLVGRPIAEPTKPKRTAARAADRAPVRSRARRPLRVAVLAVAGCAALWAALFVAGQASLSPYERWADLNEVPAVYDVVTRGLPSDPGGSTTAYADAVERLRNARSAPLGLFPNYDAAELEAIVTDLEGVIEMERNEDDLLALEARFLIGKVRLYQGRLDEAATALRYVVTNGGPSAPEARELLNYLDTPAAP